jgi:HD-like signal output (HDOD) protein
VVSGDTQVGPGGADLSLVPLESRQTPSPDALYAPGVQTDLDALIESARTLEPLPASIGRLAALVANHDADLREIVEIISYDQALTGNLLRRANSAASASRNPIRTVHEAVVRLGTGTVLALAMSASVAKRFRRAVPEYGLLEGELWSHSVRAALAAETIRSSAKVSVPAESATASLLHDMGKLVMSRFLGPGALAVLKAAAADGVSEEDVERQLLRVGHGELGAMVARHWNLPETIAIGIEHHHDPTRVDLPVAYAVHLANVAGTARTDGDTQLTRVALDALGISSSSWSAVRTAADRRYAELSDRYA